MKAPWLRIIAGTASLVGGIILNIMGILPHYAAIAQDRMPNLPGPVAGKMLVHIPPINYYMVGAGIILIAIGIFLTASGIRMLMRPSGQSPVT